MQKSPNKIEAIKIAMGAEMEAHNYYSQSAHKTTDPKGKDMFTQLAAFELSHYNNLKALIESLEKGKGWISYAGAQFSTIPEFIEGKSSAAEEKETKDDVLSILSRAIEDEKKAYEYYNKLAEETDDSSGKSMFKKWAEEEKLHTKILSDQWYSLNNQGIWVWGD